jgi:hypothetical protein
MDGHKTFLLRHLPPNIHAYLMKEQARIQLTEGRRISIERVIYRIIREKIEKK